MGPEEIAGGWGGCQSKEAPGPTDYNIIGVCSWLRLWVVAAY